MISFSLALVQFSKSDVACKADIGHLFDRLELDPFDKMVFALPLFSGGVKDDISQQGEWTERPGRVHARRLNTMCSQKRFWRQPAKRHCVHVQHRDYS